MRTPENRLWTVAARVTSAAAAAILISSEGTEVEARLKMVHQIPNGGVHGCNTCHVGRGKLRDRAKLDIPVSEHTGEAVDDGDRSCVSCHGDPTGGGSLNAFGQNVEKGFLSASRYLGDVLWGPTLAALDSDGDGFTNGEELGDPGGVWESEDPDPQRELQVTNPGDSGSRPCLAADFDGDGEVGYLDFLRFARGFGCRQGDPAYSAPYDLTGDGRVDFLDLLRFARNFGRRLRPE
jgi:hypothetical protein